MLYLFFYVEETSKQEVLDPRQNTEPRLPGNFYFNTEMQKISQEVMVFLKVPIQKKPTDKDKELLKQYKIKKLPFAVIADRYFNPLVPGASPKDPKLLMKQAVKAKLVAKKIEKDLESQYARADEYFKKEKLKSAAGILAKARAHGFVDIPAAKKIDDLFGRIDALAEDQLQKILDENLEPGAKRARLRALKSATHRDLPVYQKIADAMKDGA